MGKLMEDFLYGLLEDVKVDKESAEIKDIIAAVKELLQRLLTCVECQHPFFKSREVIPCGSMAEGTRIWRFTDGDKTASLEFDFLAILEYFSGKNFRAVHSCPAFMEIKDKLGNFPHQYQEVDDETGTPGSLSTKRVWFNYKLAWMKSVEFLCDCHKCDTDHHISDHEVEIVTIRSIIRTEQYKADCDKCQVRKPTGTLSIASGMRYHPVELNCNIALLWHRDKRAGLPTPCELSRQKKVINDAFLITVDFLPAVEVSSSNVERVSGAFNTTCDDVDNQNESALSSTNGHFCYLVPKGCKKEHTTCWKRSHVKFEKEMLATTSQTHRDCYMVLKFILDYMVADMEMIPGAPSSYILKTAVLYHIASCTASQPNFITCTLEIVEFLSNAHRHGSLAHLRMSEQNFLSAPSVLEPGFSMTKEHVQWSRNRNLVFGKCWAFIFKMLGKLEDLLPKGFNFDLIQTLLKLSTVIYGRAYLGTTFRTIHEPKEDGFLTILGKIANDEYVSRATMDSVIAERGDIENTWEAELVPEQYHDAYKLYCRMAQNIPAKFKENIKLFP